MFLETFQNSQEKQSPWVSFLNAFKNNLFIEEFLVAASEGKGHWV